MRPENIEKQAPLLRNFVARTELKAGTPEVPAVWGAAKNANGTFFKMLMEKFFKQIYYARKWLQNMLVPINITEKKNLRKRA